MKPRFGWVVVAKCNKTERSARFLASSLKIAGTAGERLGGASKMAWFFTARRQADTFARRARLAPNGFESVEVKRRKA